MRLNSKNGRHVRNIESNRLSVLGGDLNHDTVFPRFAEPIPNVTVTVGRDALLACVVDNLNGFKVAWVRVDTQTILSIHHNVITQNPRISLSYNDHRSWYLHIKNVQEVDRGWYMCQVNTDPMRSRQGYLQVVVPPSIIDRETSGDMVVLESTNVSLTCKATGYPEPYVMWRREDGEDIRYNGENVKFQLVSPRQKVSITFVMNPPHECSLLLSDKSGMPKLAPNASSYKKLVRKIREVMLINPNHFKCLKLYRNQSAVRGEKKRHATGPYYYVIHPLSKFASFLEVIAVFIWFSYMVYAPLYEFMEEKPMIVQKFMKTVVNPAHTFLITIAFNIGYIDYKMKTAIMQPKLIASNYLKTFFIIDVLGSAYPYYILELVFYDLSHIGSKRVIKEVYLLIRILSFTVRLATLLRFIKDLLSHLKFNKKVQAIFIYSLRTFFYIHFCSFFVYYVPAIIYDYYPPEESWIAQAGISCHETETLKKYCESFLVAACYFFGISHNYVGGLLCEHLVFVVISFFGRLYSLYLLADILYLFGIVGVSESWYERNLTLLQQYMESKDLPDTLRMRMLRYYEFKFERRFFNEKQIINSLSENLRTELYLFSARQLIKKVAIFKKLPSPTLGAIIASMKADTYSPRDIIIQLGSDIEDIYFICTGTVAVIDYQGTELCHLEDGDEFGISSFLLSVQLYSTVAVETTEIFTINRHLLKEFLSPYPDVMAEFYRKAKKRLADLKTLTKNRKTGHLMDDIKTGQILEHRSTKFGLMVD
ncbi:hypothetical protein NQ315_016872 [Exocentrus adspersus]|uniref:Uncharacterized protein n=1 Tax=Exocentrus adspersus TaxID=1586481 RepID=A0AAV8VXL9_9CUCU|nr:hypothetical protein NQ315_016872 [Exocentrus adspersus]